MTDKEKVINNEFEAMGESSTQAENNALIKQNLATIINENNKQDLTIFNQESQTNWTEIFGEGKGNELFGLSNHARKYVGRDLTGLDKILFERIVKKVGTLQTTKAGAIVGQTALSVVNAIPFVGNVAQLISTNGLAYDLDNALIKLEKTFSVEEVTEIVKEVGVLAGVDNTQMLTKIKELAGNKENEWQKELWEKEQKIEDLKESIKNEQEKTKRQREKYQATIEKGKEQLTKVEQASKKIIEKLTEVEQVEQELKKEKAEREEQQKKLLESQNQLSSLDKVDLEALKEKYRNLESQALTDKERLELLTEKVNDYQAAIVNLKEEREREEKEKNRFLQLYINETNSHTDEKELHGKTKKKVLALEIEKEQLESNIRVKQIELDEKGQEIENLKLDHKGEIELKNKELKTEQIKYETEKFEKEQEQQKRNQEFLQYRHWESEVAVAKVKINDLESKINNLNQQLKEALEAAKPGLTGWLAEKTGFNYVKDFFYGGFVFFVVVLVLWLVSFLWKWIIKPMIKNFTPAQKSKPVIEVNPELERINNDLAKELTNLKKQLLTKQNAISEIKKETTETE